jgi:phosphoglycolate phosphatase
MMGVNGVLSNWQVIIYDCDGVLIDSRRSNQAFYDHILQRFGLPPMTPEQLDVVHVSTARAAIDFLFQGSPHLAAAQAYQLNIDNAPFISLIKPEPHVRVILEYLRPAYHPAIATNRGKSLPLVLQHLKLADLFDLTVSCYDVSRPKPHPECLQKVLDYFRVGPREAMYIGDAALDGQVARAAGVPFVAYKNPGLEADYHLQDHLDLMDILSAA